MLVLQPQVKYSGDKRTVMVTTKATAPGGIRTEKVGLPFDPDLYDHMVEHGVVIEVGYQQLDWNLRLSTCCTNCCIGQVAAHT